jgi:ABC-2 type transport system permease protein
LGCSNGSGKTTTIIGAAVSGLFLFALYTVFQIPGYYKYGSIKGRVFMYIPVAGFLLTLSLFSKILSIGTSVIATVGNSPVLLAILVITLFIVMYALSSWFSIWIMKTRKYK